MKGTSLCSNTQIEEINLLAERLGISCPNEPQKANQSSQYAINQSFSYCSMPDQQKENIEMKMNFIDKIHQSLVNFNLNAPILYHQNSDNIVINMNQIPPIYGDQQKMMTSLLLNQQQGINIKQQQQQQLLQHLNLNNVLSLEKIKKKEEKKDNLSSKKKSERKNSKKEKNQNDRSIYKEDKENINLSQSILADSALYPVKGILKQDKKFVTFQRQSPTKTKLIYDGQIEENQNQEDFQNDYEYQQTNFNNNTCYLAKENNRGIFLKYSSKISSYSQEIDRNPSSSSIQRYKEYKNQQDQIDVDINQSKCKKQHKLNLTPSQNRSLRTSQHSQFSCEEKQREFSVNQVQLSPPQQSFMNKTISSELKKSDRKSSCSNERSKSRNNSNNNRRKNSTSQPRKMSNTIVLDTDKKSKYYQSKWLIDKSNNKKQSKNDIDMINALYEKANSIKTQTGQPQKKNFIEENIQKVNNTSNISLRRNQHTNWDEVIRKEYNIPNRNNSSFSRNDNTVSSSSSFFQSYGKSFYFQHKYIYLFLSLFIKKSIKINSKVITTKRNMLTTENKQFLLKMYLLKVNQQLNHQQQRKNINQDQINKKQIRKLPMILIKISLQRRREQVECEK